MPIKLQNKLLMNKINIMKYPDILIFYLDHMKKTKMKI